MSLSDDEEALFDDIYADEDTKKEESPKQEAKEQEQEQEPVKKEESNVVTKPEEEAETATTSTDVKKDEGPQDSEKSVESKEPTTSQTEASSSTTVPTPPPGVQQQQEEQQQAVPQSSGSSNDDQAAARKADLSRDAGKMFIGGLDWDTTEDRLKEYFSQYGEVIDHTIMREPSTGRSRGFGFLTFADKSSVDAVVKTQHVLDGKVIDPKRAIPREEQDKTGKIFVGGIPPEVRPHEFEAFFSKYGTIIDAQLMLDKDTGRSRGFGFVTFDSPEAVDKVCQGKYIQFGSRQIEVKRAEPRGPQQQQNHINAQQQRYLQQKGYGAQSSVAPIASPAAALPNQMYGGVPGVTPEQMTEYYQRMQQYWAQLQQQGGPAAQMAQYAQMLQQQQMQAGIMPGVPGSAPSIVPGNDGGNGADRPFNAPRGPSGHNGYAGRGRGRGRGGYNNNNRRGGYHPYSRDN